MSEDEAIEILKVAERTKCNGDTYTTSELNAIETILDLYNKLKRQIKIKDEYLSLIIGLGFDYDGEDRSVEGLKSVIDQLVDYAKKAIDNDDKSPIYGIDDEAPKRNILLEELKMSENELKKYHHFKIKTSDGIELDLIETKYYETLEEKLRQEREKNKELEEKLKMSIAMLTKGTYPETEKGANDFDNYFISKDKIRAKIKELEKEIHVVTPDTHIIEKINEFKNEGALNILKELLEEE